MACFLNILQGKSIITYVCIPCMCFVSYIILCTFVTIPGVSWSDIYLDKIIDEVKILFAMQICLPYQRYPGAHKNED